MNSIDDGANMASEFQAIRERHQALLILRILEREESGAVNDRILSHAMQLYALDADRPGVLALLERLERQGLVVKIDGAPEVVIVRLTEAGLMVALGHRQADGVLRAFPDCPY